MGRNGEIEVSEYLSNGKRAYFEGSVLQSQSTRDGGSILTYVKLLDEMLRRPASMVLGCCGGNLATKLFGLGKRLPIVDNNPISFVIAQQFFGLPEGLPCVVSDFQKYVFDDHGLYDAVAISVGGPSFRFDGEFAAQTCDAIRARLAPGGRIVMNATVNNDIDPVPDWIAARLAGDPLHPWLVDEDGIENRNEVIACLPEKYLIRRISLRDAMRNNGEKWPLRRGRLRSGDIAYGART